MPYIPTHSRPYAARNTPSNSGELNYKITTEIHKYLLKHGICYNNINECIGVLECVKQELYRRVVAPYEERKIKENTDLDTQVLIDGQINSKG
jgi:hypothetical protein